MNESSIRGKDVLIAGAGPTCLVAALRLCLDHPQPGATVRHLKSLVRCPVHLERYIRATPRVAIAPMNVAQIPKAAGADFEIVERNYQIVRSLRPWSAQNYQNCFLGNKSTDGNIAARRKGFPSLQIRKKEVFEMKSKKDPNDCNHCGIPLYLGSHDRCGAGQVHAESAERSRVFRVRRR
jgi:hypothetical protein